MITVSLISQKGGTGKTSTAHALGAGLAQRGHSVLMIDLDAQANLTYLLQAKPKRTIADVLQGEARTYDAIVNVALMMDAIASSTLLSTLQLKNQHQLERILEPVNRRYDYCIIDNPPSLSMLTLNALTASDRCIIPIQADVFSLQALPQIYSTIETIRANGNPDLIISGILMTRFNKRAILSRDALDIIKRHAEQMGTRVFDTMIRESISIKEAQALRKDIYTYGKKTNGAIDYNQFVDEFIKEEL